MPTPDKVQQIFEDLANAQRGNMGNPEDYIEFTSITDARHALAELVEGEKINPTNGIPRWFKAKLNTSAVYGYNAAISDIATFIRGVV